MAKQNVLKLRLPHLFELGIGGRWIVFTYYYQYMFVQGVKRMAEGKNVNKFGKLKSTSSEVSNQSGINIVNDDGNVKRKKSYLQTRR